MSIIHFQLNSVFLCGKAIFNPFLSASDEAERSESNL